MNQAASIVLTRDLTAQYQGIKEDVYKWDTLTNTYEVD